MVEKILAALDGSKKSESMIPYLETLLSNVDGNVTLLKVIPPGDEGEGDNRYIWATSPSPRTGEQRRVENTDGKHAAVIVVVDR